MCVLRNATLGTKTRPSNLMDSVTRTLEKRVPGLFAQLNKTIVNDDKGKPSKKHIEMQRTRVVSLLHNLSFLRNQHWQAANKTEVQKQRKDATKVRSRVPY